jgi:predicted secreted protein
MPSLMRFLMITGTLSALVFGGLFALSTYYEPDLQEESKSVPSLKIRKE